MLAAGQTDNLAVAAALQGQHGGPVPRCSLRRRRVTGHHLSYGGDQGAAWDVVFVLLRHQSILSCHDYSIAFLSC